MKSQIGCLQLEEKMADLVEVTTQEIFKAFPGMEERYGKEGLQRCREDIGFHYAYLKTAICFDEKELFADYFKWVHHFFKSINLPAAYTDEPFEIIVRVSGSLLDSGPAGEVKEYIRYALEQGAGSSAPPASFIADDNQLNLLATQYLNALLRRDRALAERLISDALENEVSVKDIYLHVFQPAQLEIGRLWQENKISVAMEHYFTAATQFIMSRHYHYIFSSEKMPWNMVATSVSGELHELGIRMVSDFFELEGWNTTYLGSNTPDNAIVNMLRETDADVLAISATIPFNLPNVTQLIRFVRGEMKNDAPRILVGGRAFSSNPELWKKMEADGFATDAEGAVKTAGNLINLK